MVLEAQQLIDPPGDFSIDFPYLAVNLLATAILFPLRVEATDFSCPFCKLR